MQRFGEKKPQHINQSLNVDTLQVLTTKTWGLFKLLFLTRHIFETVLVNMNDSGRFQYFFFFVSIKFLKHLLQY